MLNVVASFSLLLPRMPTLLRSSLSLPKLHASASLNDVDLMDNLRHTTPAMSNPRLHSKLYSADDIRSTANVDDDIVPSFRAGPGDIPIMEESVTYDTNLKQKGVIYSGVLYRRRRGPMAQWIERWTLSHFVLTWNCLRYYSQNGEKLRGEIDLSNATIQVLPMDSVFNGRQATLWRFAISNTNRRLLMSAMTEYEMNVWVKHLLVAMGMDELKQATILNRMHRAESDDVPLVDFEDTITATMQEIDECEQHSISSTESTIVASRV
ncbi:hypothetical protein THRCLA_06534 [Thraustotheca clavata]|uniref:PH domain-containing protein n=1 Tax=Thraustotheca clavata TaxID=74557 RepID=A0A1V9ZN91_9STRA|nr:hypothetical protein THRCLA_06534 [Thraustotheca clavata]